MKRITIKDLAEHAEVSRGTVDRVIHNRGHVAPAVKLKIQRAIDELGYTPNIIARTLAQNHQHSISVLMPNPENDEFWLKPTEGIADRIKEYEAFGVNVDTYYFQNDDPQSFTCAGQRMLDAEPDAILMACEFYQESLSLLDRIQNAGIPVVLFMTQIDHPLGENYIGQDSFQSGMMVGRLFDATISDQELHILSINLGASEGNTLQIKNKIRGMQSYFQDHKSFSLSKVEIINFKDEHLLKKVIDDTLFSNPSINGVIVTNSRAKYIGEIICNHQRSRELCFIGFDLLGDNVALLNRGVLSYLINQNPYEQVGLGIKRLVDQLVFRRSVHHKSYVPLDIVIKENVAFYI